MDLILHQLVALLLGAVPTAILFIVLVVAYRFLVYGPLTQVLAERRARTEGAVEKAHAAIDAADAKTQEYEARLRAARTEIFRRREERMQYWNAERERTLESNRQATHEHVQRARAALDAEVENAKAQIESSIDQLAAQILKVILPVNVASGAAARSPVQGAMQGESPR